MTTPGASAHASVAQLPALTSLRFVAAALVVLFHYKAHLFSDNGWQPPRLADIGYTGVTFFFILSGFILAYNYWQTDFSQRSNLIRFFQARIARVYPVYICSLLVSLPLYFVSSAKNSAPDLHIYNLLALPLAPLGLHAWLPGAACALNCPSWSISNEFFFYAILPVVLGSVIRNRFRWAAVATLGIVLVGWGTSAVWGHFGDVGDGSLVGPDAGLPAGVVLLKQFIKMFPVLRVFEFLLGIVLFAFWQKLKDRLSTTALLIASLAGATLMSVGLDVVAEPLLHNGGTAIVWAPIILGGAQMRAGVLVSAPAAYLGRLSFSLYLLHAPVLSMLRSFDKHLVGGGLFAVPWLGATVAILSAILAAALAFHVVEEPMRRRIMRIRFEQLWAVVRSAGRMNAGPLAGKWNNAREGL